MSTSDRTSEASQLIKEICARPDSKSQFFPYGSSGYRNSVRHYLESSCEAAYSAVEPGDVDDLAEIMKVVREKKVPFAIKCGGHATNPKFSSTTGIQIALSRLNRITYNNYKVPGKEESIDLEAGCLFDEVYRALPPDRNIVGGYDDEGIGITGWLLGGGYSMKTNEFGLGIDNILGFKVVLPNGEIKIVRYDDEHEDNRELFWALKGGGNNFGVVVQFTLQPHVQGPTYGGVLSYTRDKVENVMQAILNFSSRASVDPNLKKATIRPDIGYSFNPSGQKFKLTVICLYDGPQSEPPSNPFQEFLDIDHEGDLEETSHETFRQKTARAWRELYETVPSSNVTTSGHLVGVGENPRGRWGSVMLGEYTQPVLDEVVKQIELTAPKLANHNGKLFSIGIRPFNKTIFDNSPDAGWPHKKGEPNGPVIVFSQWQDKNDDDFWIPEVKRVMTALGSKIPDNTERPINPNIAIAEYTTVQDVYRGNLGTLIAIRNKVDPEDVMGHAGGFKIPLN